MNYSKRKKGTNSRKKSQSASLAINSEILSNTAINRRSDLEVFPFDRHLYQRAHEQWLFGDWESLIKLNQQALETHPERAKLALLVAAAHQQVGTPEQVRIFACLAKEWGCDRKLMSRVLIAGACETLSLASAVKGDLKRAERLIQQSAKLVLPGASSQFVAPIKKLQQSEKIKRAQHLRQMRIAASCPASLDASPTSKDSEHPSYLDHPRFSASAYQYYQTLSDAKDRQPFLLIDSKSLPRSGLHYLKNTLARLLQKHFSFCEWYQEPGCCKKQPCAITAFAESAESRHELRIRLIKSHDFNLDDPVFPALSQLRRLVLIRDPLFVLTSYFALDQLSRYKAFLSRHGINLEKIFLSHESELVSQAYRLIDQCYEPIEAPELEQWLTDKTKYINGFLEKWVYSEADHPNPYTHVMHYEDIDAYIVELLLPLMHWVDESTKMRIEEFAVASKSQFKPRNDPFQVDSVCISEYLVGQADLFRGMADSIRLPKHST